MHTWLNTQILEVLYKVQTVFEKIRWARGNRGKSAGVRVIYYYHSEIMPLYLLAVFGKNEKSNISMEEKHSLSSMVKELVAYWRYRNEQGIH